MKPDAYQRNIAARAFDVARYLLFLGIPTNVGQVTSIRTLEKQIRRLKASEYAELRELGRRDRRGLRRRAGLLWDENAPREPVAPTLAQWVEADQLPARVAPRPAAVGRAESARARRHRGRPRGPAAARRHLPPTSWPRCSIRSPTGRSASCTSWRGPGAPQRRREVLDLAARSRTDRDELLRGFRGGLYAFDIVMDIGAYRDLHRHRRCQQFRQAFSTALGFETPKAIAEAGLTGVYEAAMREALATVDSLPAPGSHYLLPFGARSRFLFKMDFAEVEYICRVRSGVKGHFSYRDVAWHMKLKMEELEPELGGLIEATPPWMEDPLRR